MDDKDKLKLKEKRIEKRKIVTPMGIGLTLGLVFGAAFGNIAIGLSIGIIIGGIGVLIRKNQLNERNE